jgi:outer membrane protein TolC/ABC-type transporter MlaC component
MTLARRTAQLLLASALAAPPANARTLDRRSAVHAALAQNPQIAAARAQEAVVKAQRRQADSARWPMVTFTAGIGPSMKATVVPGTQVESTKSLYHDLSVSDLSAVFLGNLTAIQPLYTFGKIAIRQEAADAGLRAREAQTRMTKADVAFEVAQIYEGYLYARDAQRYFDETLHWLASTRQTAQDHLAGKVKGVTERDLLRLDAGIAAANLGLDQANAGMAQASAGLIAYLGLPAGEPLTFAEDELIPVGGKPGDMPSLVALAIAHRPELEALRNGQLAMDALARAEAAGFKPDLFLLGFVSAAYTPGRDWAESRYVIDPLNNFIPGLLLGLRWQFQGAMAQSRAAEQQANADALRFTAEWATDGIPAEVRKAYEDIRRTDLDIEKGTIGVQKSRKWMVMAGSDYGIGFGDVREVADAVTAYVELRVAVMKSTFDHNVAMAALAKATGTLDGGSELFYMAPPEPAPAHGENREPNQPTAIETHRDRTVLAALKVARASEGAVGQEGEPQVIIRKTVDDAFAVLKDKSLATPRMRPKRIGALRTIADRVFDWAEMAKSSLGVQWRTLHAPDRARFVEVFKDLLAAQYIDDIDRFQGTEKVTVDGADHEGEDVNVHTTLITAAHDHVPIDYRMRNEQSRWAVVDISIEGVSMVNHFRSTFASALANMSADQLIEKLRQQLPENLRP